jgi:multiple sugar transport system ATP-binding protein
MKDTALPFLTLDTVSKSYGGTEVLPGLSLDVEEGEFVVLVGPSGCGKSTLLRMVAGLEDITSGALSMSGRILNDLEPVERDVAMVFQNYALYPHMTVRRNMDFALRLTRLDRTERARRVEWAAGLLGLSPLLDRYPRQLSGGQRQRVAMGRAIVRKPNIFLFDEPLSNLDAKLRVRMRTEIKRLHQVVRTTTLYVTHDQIEAMTLADRVVVMNRGRIEQIGAPTELYDRPETIFVAGFIGSPQMNLLPATARDGAVRPDCGGTWRCATPSPLPPRLTVGVRPEHLDFAPEGLAVAVEVVEPTGAETLVMCRTRIGGEEVAVSMRGHAKVSPGDTGHLAPATGRLHLFDPETGRRCG